MTERAIPTAIFSADATTKRHYLKQWLKDPGMTEFDIRDILDWDYYTTRLSGYAFLGSYVCLSSGRLTGVTTVSPGRQLPFPPSPSLVHSSDTKGSCVV